MVVMYVFVLCILGFLFECCSYLLRKDMESGRQALTVLIITIVSQGFFWLGKNHGLWGNQ